MPRDLSPILPLAIIAWAAVCAPGQAAAADDRGGRNRIVAIVNTDVITAADVAQAMAPLYGQYQALYSPEELPAKMDEAQRQIINLLVEERVMLQEAQAPRQIEVAKGRWMTPPPITVGEEDVADAVAQAKRQFASEEEFQAVLAQHGMVLEDLEKRYRDQITIQRLVDREVRYRLVIAPSEVSAYYQQHMDEYRQPEAARVSNILIRVSGAVGDAQAKATIHDLQMAIVSGADFAELARKHSEGPNAKDGGAMGWVTRGQLMPELEEVIFSTDPGQLAPVVKSSLGYHLFRVEERRPPRTAPLADVSKAIQEILARGQFRQRYEAWIAKLKERAYITIKSPQDL